MEGRREGAAETKTRMRKRKSQAAEMCTRARNSMREKSSVGDRHRKKSRERIKKRRLCETCKKTQENRGQERGDSSHACHFFFFSVIFPNLGPCISPGQPAAGIYSPVGLPANKTHVDL